ncbi:HNH endonuclease [Bacillus velezensis]|uniref:HNH endonuclease n=1 Tax=Bacillus velezensis TaxID=492670 RepID=UPI0018E8C538|nr:HNH endonuclease [Bacillus velezensis]
MHPITGIPYDKDGFPIFDPIVEVKIDKSLYLAKDTVQFKSNRTPVARNQQKSRVEKSLYRNAVEANYKRKKPKGFTWHHHQNEGIMQLVDADIHGKTGHTGGRNIWGGGSEYR